MPCILITGGSGYIGTKLTEYFLNRGYTVYLLDLAESVHKKKENVIFTRMDIRKPIDASFIKHPIEWILHLAAIHREPGHVADEYFETNLKGAENIVNLANKIGCSNILFTSSISVYGVCKDATTEEYMTQPNTPYGVSKLVSEYIFKLWQAQSQNRRLIIVRPGVIYGPGDPGNILRMIRAVKKGYFVVPTSLNIKKSYGYIYGFCDSVGFTMGLNEPLVVYNYTEKDTESLGAMVRIIRKTLGYKGVLVQVPLLPLIFLSKLIHVLFPDANGIHPERVRKVARPTHIKPQFLINKGFKFKLILRVH